MHRVAPGSLRSARHGDVAVFCEVFQCDDNRTVTVCRLQGCRVDQDNWVFHPWLIWKRKMMAGLPFWVDNSMLRPKDFNTQDMFPEEFLILPASVNCGNSWLMPKALFLSKLLRMSNWMSACSLVSREMLRWFLKTTAAKTRTSMRTHRTRTRLT